MGPMLPIVNPVLWEIGHVGWFHEYWTLRHAHGEAPLLDRADSLWNSSTVAHATRWDLDLPDRNGVFGYMADVLERQVDRLGGGVEAPAALFLRALDPARGHACRGAGLYAPDARLCAAARSWRILPTHGAGRMAGRRRRARRTVASRLDCRRRLHLRQREMGARGRRLRRSASPRRR